MISTKKKVLLVDDNRSILELYKRSLEFEGSFEVDVDTSAVSALERLADGSEYDLVITDIMMAKMDGWELLETLRGALGIDADTLPVIIITAFEEHGTETKAWRKGAAAVHFKGRDPLSKLVNLAKIHTGQARSKFHDT